MPLLCPVAMILSAGRPCQFDEAEQPANAASWLGAHDFLIGRHVRGIVTALLCLFVWAIHLGILALILWVIAIAEGVFALCMTDAQFAQEYDAPS